MKDDINVYYELLKEQKGLTEQGNDNERLQEVNTIIKVWEDKYPELLSK